MSTGYHAAKTGGVAPGKTVTVIGDGAVGLSAVLSAKILGADRIILMGRHQTRTDLGREFGATDIVPDRGDDGIAKIKELTGGDGTHVVLEAVGLKPALETAFAVVRRSGLHIGRWCSVCPTSCTWVLGRVNVPVLIASRNIWQSPRAS